MKSIYKDWRYWFFGFTGAAIGNSIAEHFNHSETAQFFIGWLVCSIFMGSYSAYRDWSNNKQVKELT